MNIKWILFVSLVFISSCKTPPENELKTDFAFTRSTGKVNFLNAYQMTYLSDLAYEDENRISAFANSFDFKLNHVEDVNGTFYYIISNETYIILAFRGTEKNFKDLWTDIKFFHQSLVKGSVHCGFCASYSNVKLKIRQIIRQLINEKPREFYITGHSLGGALGNIAALDLTLFFKETKNFSVSGLYTFGSPRVFDSTGVDHLNSLVPQHYRFVFGNDKVVQMPWVIQNYLHGGNAIRFERKTCKILEGQKKLGPFLRTLRNMRNFWRVGGFKDHKLENYRECLMK